MTVVRYTPKTLKLLRSSGLVCDVVEKWIPPGIRRDLFGIIDIIGMGQGRIWGVQSTSIAQRSKHKKTIIEELKEKTSLWIENGGVFLLVCWGKEPRGKAFRYAPRVEQVQRSDGKLELLPWESF